MVDRNETGDFEIELENDWPQVYTSRNLAIISLHPYFTRYLSGINSRVKPFDLQIMDLKQISFRKDRRENPVYTYSMKKGWAINLRNFAYSFRKEYPRVEQVYAFSEYNCENAGPQDNSDLVISLLISKQDRTEGSAVSAINRELGNILLKRCLVLPCFGSKTGSYYSKEDLEASDNQTIKKTIEKSLEFSSW